MESVINSIKTLFGTYGFKVASIVLLTIFIVNILKKPIISASKKYAIKNNCDKSVITRYVSILPFIVSFVIAFLWELIIVDFNFSAIDYETLLTNVLMYGSLAIATFETLKIQFEAYAAKKQSNTTKVEKQSTTNVFIEEKKSEDIL